MAIGTNDAIRKFGTTDAIDDGTTSAVTDGSFSVAADTADWTNDDDAPNATLILNATFSSTPTANTTIDVFDRLMDIDGTTDSPEPGTGATVGNEYIYLGSFPVDDGYGTSAFALALEVELPAMKTSQVHRIYIKNNGGGSIAANWDLDIVPWTIGPG